MKNQVIDFGHTRNSMNNTPEKISQSSHNSRAKFTDPLPWVVLLSVVALDQVTKWIVIETLAVGESWPETGLFRFTHAWNTGTAFSLFQGQGDLLTWVSLGAVCVLAWIYRSLKNPHWLLRFAFGLQFGGAIGNIIDRIRLGHVTDFFDVGWWPVFNIADSSIVVGISLMLIYFWFLQAKIDEARSNKSNSSTNPISNTAITPDQSNEPKATNTKVT